MYLFLHASSHTLLSKLKPAGASTLNQIQDKGSVTEDLVLCEAAQDVILEYKDMLSS